MPPYFTPKTGGDAAKKEEKELLPRVNQLFSFRESSERITRALREERVGEVGKQIPLI